MHSSLRGWENVLLNLGMKELKPAGWKPRTKIRGSGKNLTHILRNALWLARFTCVKQAQEQAQGMEKFPLYCTCFTNFTVWTGCLRLCLRSLYTCEPGLIAVVLVPDNVDKPKRLISAKPGVPGNSVWCCHVGSSHLRQNIWTSRCCRGFEAWRQVEKKKPVRCKNRTSLS